MLQLRPTAFLVVPLVLFGCSTQNRAIDKNQRDSSKEKMNDEKKVEESTKDETSKDAVSLTNPLVGTWETDCLPGSVMVPNAGTSFYFKMRSIYSAQMAIEMHYREYSDQCKTSSWDSANYGTYDLPASDSSGVKYLDLIVHRSLITPYTQAVAQYLKPLCNIMWQPLGSPSDVSACGRLNQFVNKTYDTYEIDSNGLLKFGNLKLDGVMGTSPDSRPTDLQSWFYRKVGKNVER